jgi:hypothetical protein
MNVWSVELQTEEGTPQAALSREGLIEMPFLENVRCTEILHDAATPHTECSNYGLLHVFPTSLK